MKFPDMSNRVIAGWIYVPGLMMILLGTAILLFPSFLPCILAGCFILAGLTLIQSMRILRKAAMRVRTKLEVAGYQMQEASPADLFPRRMSTPYIN